jgi:hypothetical protein
MALTMQRSGGRQGLLGFGAWRASGLHATTMLRLQYNYLPADFACAGAFHRVQRLERCWENRQQRWFAVYCTSGQRYTLVQDLHTGIWRGRTATG